MSTARSLALLAGILVLSGAVAAADNADPLFRRVRQAVSHEDTAELQRLVRGDPWGFREVTNQLADLALFQTLEKDEEDVVGGYNRFVVAGMLAGIYVEETGDLLLAERLRAMQGWDPGQLAEREEVQQILVASASEQPPVPRRLEKAIDVCRKLGDERCVGMLHGSLGSLLEQKEHVDAAALNYERAGQAFRRAGEIPRLRDALLARGQMLLNHGRLDAAAADLGAAAAVAEQLDDGATRAASLMLVAQALAAQDRREQALKALSAARDTALDSGLPVLAARAILIRTALRDAGGPGRNSALDYEAAARLAEEGKDRVIVAQAYLEAARAHEAAGQAIPGAADIEKALAAARLAGMEDEIGGMLLLAADLHQQADDVPRALRRLDEALRRFAAAGDAAGQARAQEQKGALLLEQERFQEAATALTEAHRLARQAGDPLTEGRAEGGLASLAMMDGRPEEAMHRYRRCADLLGAAGDSFQAMRMRRLADSIEERLAERAAP